MTKWTPINPDDYKDNKKITDDELELDGFDDEDDDEDDLDTGNPNDDDLDDDDGIDTGDDEEDELEEAPKGKGQKPSRANERIRELNAKAKQAEALAEQREAEARELKRKLKEKEKEAHEAKKAQATNLTATIESQKTTLSTQLDMIKKALKKAEEDDDSDTKVELMAKMGETQLTLQALNSWKPEVIADLPADDDKDEDETPRKKAPAKLEDAPKATQRWLKSNDWFLNPESKAEKEAQEEIVIYNQALINKGYDPTSKEFYELIDKRVKKLGLLAKDTDDELESDEEDDESSNSSRSSDVKPKKKISQKVSGPNRNSSRKASPNKVTLTSEEKSMADILGVSYQDYAKEKLKMERAEKAGSQYVKIDN